MRKGAAIILASHQSATRYHSRASGTVALAEYKVGQVEVIMVVVRWYLRYGSSYRDAKEWSLSVVSKLTT
jgi:hypothetical protein